MFNNQTRIKRLSGDYIGSQPVSYEWGEGWTESWDFLVADHCDQCHKVIVGTGPATRHQDNHIDDDSQCQGQVWLDGPMMNYYYPVDFRRVGSMLDAAVALVDLPLCPVDISNSDITGIALTGGGMDLTWEICEAFMRLGYLPPVHFARLPGLASMGLGQRQKWVLAGMARSLEIVARDARASKQYITELRRSLREGAAG